MKPRRKSSLLVPATAALPLLWLCAAGPGAAQAVDLPGPEGPVGPERVIEAQSAEDDAANDAAEAAPFDEADIAAAGDDDEQEFPPNLDPIIAIYHLNPRLDPAQPWVITPDGLVIPQRRASRPPTPVFRAPLHDAFSTRRGGNGIELTFGGQPALGGTLGVRVIRLEIEPGAVEMTVGESFDLDDLTVRAYDADGELVERAPLRLEIEGPQGFVDMAAFESDSTALTALTRGVGRIWVTSLLPARLDEPFALPVVVNVRAPADRGFRLSSRIHENIPAVPSP